MNWLNKILQGIGRWPLRGWLAGILKTIITAIVVIIVVITGC